MESSRKVGASSSSSTSSSSSIALELFGPKESSSSSSSSSSVFGSMFGPPPVARGREKAQAGGAGNQEGGNYKYGSSEMGQNGKGGESSKVNPYYQQETTGPCSFSSSIHYGGQEVYSPTTPTADSHHTFKTDEQEEDPNSASRGNWWQGSVYY